MRIAADLSTARAAMKGRRPRRAPRIALLVLAVLSLLVLAALHRGLVTRPYRVSSAKLSNETPIRLVVLADLHSYVHGADQQPLIQKIKRLEPDAICLVGDIADEIRPLDGMVLLLEGIRDLAPCYYVTGSHEYWGDSAAIKEILRAFGVTVLEGETRTVALKGQRIAFSGLDDPAFTPNKGYDMLLRPFERLDQGAFQILLSHRPDPIETFAGYGFDLVLAGHTHGGQVRVPFVLNGLYAPDQGFFPAYAGGLYLVNGTALVVSRGLSNSGGVPRVFNPPEVVAVDLIAKNPDRK